MAAPAAQRLIDAANLGSARIGYAVADARTGEMLEVMNPLLQLPPASVTKALTALYALDSLGESYQFSTQLIATGGVENGRVNGDLILVGGGDPTLSTDAMGDLARTMRDAGIREVRGAFKVHSGAAALCASHRQRAARPCVLQSVGFWFEPQFQQGAF